MHASIFCSIYTTSPQQLTSCTSTELCAPQSWTTSVPPKKNSISCTSCIFKKPFMEAIKFQFGNFYGKLTRLCSSYQFRLRGFYR